MWLRVAFVASLLAWAALGCAHERSSRHRFHTEVAGASVEQRGAEPVVDVSELPTIVDAPVDTPAAEAPKPRPRLALGVLSAATEVASWIPADWDGWTAEIELRNACSLDFEYAFGPSNDPGAVVEGRRPLSSHSIQTQLIPDGHWLHLWDDGRWLGTAVVTVERSRMEVSSGCDTLVADFDLSTGATSFAIHWEMDVADGEDRASASSELPRLPDDELALADGPEAGPEPWGTEADDGRIHLRLSNRCPEAIDYAFTSTVDDELTEVSTIPGHTQRRIEVPASWWIRYRGADQDWHAGATTEHSGARLFITADCLGHGVKLGDVSMLEP